MSRAHNTTVEHDELAQLAQEVKRAVAALEVCWICERVTECGPGTVEDGACWLCADCELRETVCKS